MRAATQGRVLVLEGLEKAERNVLPVLNNLLENREMQLEDGRFLMSAERYDKLLQVSDVHSPTYSRIWSLRRSLSLSWLLFIELYLSWYSHFLEALDFHTTPTVLILGLEGKVVLP